MRYIVKFIQILLYIIGYFIFAPVLDILANLIVIIWYFNFNHCQRHLLGKPVWFIDGSNRSWLDEELTYYNSPGDMILDNKTTIARIDREKYNV